MRPSPFRSRMFAARQRGAIVIAAAVAMGVCVALMASADIGYLFYIKREFQKSADLAALAGAQLLPNACATATASASGNALANLASHNFSQTPTVTVACGIWASTNNAATGDGGGQYFVVGGTPSTINGVRVVITGSAPAILPFIANRSIAASAVAVREQPTAVISTGSQLAALRLGGINLAVLGPDGAARITLAGLLDRLGIPVAADIGIGELNNLLSVNNVNLGTLLTAAAQALPSTGAALSAQVTVLNQAVQASATLKSATIKLGGANSAVSLFTSIGGSAQDSASLARSALHTELKVTDLISTALSIASTNNAVAVPSLTLAGIQVSSGIVSPPSVAAGPVGTTARQAQIRLFVDIDSAAIPLVGPVAAALETRVHLPLFLDVTRGTARINAISCSSSPRTVDVLVNQTILGACVGKVADAVRFTAVGLCDAATPADLQPEVLLKLLGANLLTTTIRVDALSSTETMMGMVAGETRNSANTLPIGSTVSNIVGALVSTLGKLTTTAPPATSTPSQVAVDTANAYLAQTPKDSFGRYQIDPLIGMLQNGKADVSLAALGTWDMPVPYPCPPLYLTTCYSTGSVWASFKATVTGAGSGLLGGVLGTALGGLVVNNCYGLIASLVNYNGCIASNLASYLQSKPGGVLTPPATGACATLLCTALKPVTDGLTSVLNSIGSSLASTLASTLGLTLGQTSVTVQAISCGNVRIVY